MGLKLKPPLWQSLPQRHNTCWFLLEFKDGSCYFNAQNAEFQCPPQNRINNTQTMTELKLEERVRFISYFMAHVSLGPTFHLSSSEHQHFYGNLSQRVKDQFPHLSCAWPHNQVGNKMSVVSVVYRFQEISLKIRSVPLQGLLQIIFCSCPTQVYGEQLGFNSHLGAWLRRTEWQSKTGKAFCHP